MKREDCDTCEGEGYLEDSCGVCNGSGEGMYDGSSCYYCKGSGVEKIECDACGLCNECLELLEDCVFLEPKLNKIEYELDDIDHAIDKAYDDACDLRDRIIDRRNEP